MVKRTLIIMMSFLLLVGLMASPASAKMKTPVIKLERVDIASYQPFYVKPRIGYKDPKEAGKTGTYGYSSTLGMAYIFSIENPNMGDIMLDELYFTVSFEGFDVHTPMFYEDWKTEDQLREGSGESRGVPHDRKLDGGVHMGHPDQGDGDIPRCLGQEVVGHDRGL
jgi:hypothetical protein